jgi:hypothetical protein
VGSSSHSVFINSGDIQQRAPLHSINITLQRVFFTVLLYSSATNYLIFRYPSEFLDIQLDRFFDSSSMSQATLLPLIRDENQYRNARQQFIQTPTLKQTQLMKSIDSISLYNHTHNRILDSKDNKSDIIKEKKYHNHLIVHYTHEKRLEPYKRDIHQIWNQLFLNTPVSEVRLIIGSKNSRSIRRELVRTCPLPSVLVATKLPKQTTQLTTNK